VWLTIEPLNFWKLGDVTTFIRNYGKQKSTDPVSGKQVDKATSVIAAANNGNVYYLKMKRI